jgi:hypothetical protein
MSADERDTVIKKAEGWLRELGFEYSKEKMETSDGKTEPMLFIRFKGKGELPDYDVQINAHGDWVICRARLAKAKLIPKSKRAELYHDLLNMIYRYSELTFSSNDEGDVFVECEVHRNVRPLTFELEFKTLPVGMSIFAEQIAPKYGVKLGGD